MKKTIPEYAKTLSDNEYEVLEEIFVKKYSQFLEMYYLIKDYSDYIVSLKYKKDDKEDTLTIALSLAKLNIDKVVKSLKESINDKNHVDIWNEKRVIHIKIDKIVDGDDS